MPSRDIIVIGASAGGVEALTCLCRDLPGDIPAALFVVLHLSEKSVLPQILARAGALPVATAVHQEPIRPGRIYVAPPDRHLLVDDGFVRLVRGPKENGHRPAVDPLFRTAAYVYGPRVVGVVLTGSMNCGSAGLLAVKRQGGIAVVQSPEDAFCPDMPRNALLHVAADHVVPLAGIAPLLVRLSNERVEDPPLVTSKGAHREKEIDPPLREGVDVLGDTGRSGHLVLLSCPDCGGSLSERVEGELLVFRCRKGHSYTAESFHAKQSIALEAALWAALRALEESGALLLRLANRARQLNQPKSAARFEERSAAAMHQSLIIRERLLRRQSEPFAAKGFPQPPA